MDLIRNGLNEGQELKELPSDFELSTFKPEYTAGLIVGHIGSDVFARNIPDYVVASMLHEEYEKYSVKQDLIFTAVRQLFDKDFADEVIDCFERLQDDPDDDFPPESSY